LQELAGDEDGDGCLDIHLRLQPVDELHQPVEDRYVAVHRDVDVVEGLLVTQVLLKVLHCREKKVLVASEVLSSLLGLIANVDENLIFGRGSRWLPLALVGCGKGGLDLGG